MFLLLEMISLDHCHHQVHHCSDHDYQNLPISPPRPHSQCLQGEKVKTKLTIAAQVFSLVALIIFLEMMGIFYGNVYFWVITLSIYILGIVLVSFVLYFSHAMEVEERGEEEGLRSANAGSVWKLNLRTLVRWTSSNALTYLLFIKGWKAHVPRPITTGSLEGQFQKE